MISKKTKLNEIDHRLLLLLIQGRTMEEAGVEMNITRATLATRFIRIKQCLDCKTSYQVIALEMVNLLFKDEPNEELIEEPKFLTKANGM